MVLQSSQIKMRQIGQFNSRVIIGQTDRKTNISNYFKEDWFGKPALPGSFTFSLHVSQLNLEF